MLNEIEINVLENCLGFVPTTNIVNKEGLRKDLVVNLVEK